LLLSGWRVAPFNGLNTTLVRINPNPKRPYVEGAADPIDSLVELVDGQRWFSDLEKLATFNRYTSGTGIAAAQEWLIAQLQVISKQYPHVVITTQSFPVRSTITYNIIATIQGHTSPDKWVIIGGHYDSTSQSPTTLAPGAEDNASGAAAVVEMIRVFAAKPPPSTAIFILFSGEEQGLYGSNYHASQIVNDGFKYKVQVMHNMDMIAFKAGSNSKYQVLLETNPEYESLFAAYTNSATAYTDLDLLYSLYAFGSDHEPYLKKGIPALLTIDGDWDLYPDYHRTTDTPSKCNAHLGEQIIRMGVGAVAYHLGYPNA